MKNVVIVPNHFSLPGCHFSLFDLGLAWPLGKSTSDIYAETCATWYTAWLNFATVDKNGREFQVDYGAGKESVLVIVFECWDLPVS